MISLRSSLFLNYGAYHKNMWFSKRAITNIIPLSNAIQQHRVAYESEEKMFIVHREADEKPNMEFIMHKVGLHYYDPRNRNFTFINTVFGTRKVTLRDWSKVQKFLVPFMPRYPNHPGKTSSG